jgi:hypothetical protein
MRRLLCLGLLVSQLVMAESFNASSSFSLGPNGVSVKNPPMSAPAGISYDGKGVFSTSFSLTGNGRQADFGGGAPVRVVPGAVAPSVPSSFTDSDTFFKSVGK